MNEIAEKAWKQIRECFTVPPALDGQPIIQAAIEEAYKAGFKDCDRQICEHVKGMEARIDMKAREQWVCPDCGTTYTKDVGKCGELRDCSRPNVVPVIAKTTSRRGK